MCCVVWSKYLKVYTYSAERRSHVGSTVTSYSELIGIISRPGTVYPT